MAPAYSHKAGMSVNALKHWIAATWFIVVGSILVLGVVAAIVYLVYLIFTEAISFLYIGLGFAVFFMISNWSGDFIDRHGWPWRPKPPQSPQSERG